MLSCVAGFRRSLQKSHLTLHRTAGKRLLFVNVLLFVLASARERERERERGGDNGRERIMVIVCWWGCQAGEWEESRHMCCCRDEWLGLPGGRRGKPDLNKAHNWNWHCHWLPSCLYQENDYPLALFRAILREMG